ncbi:hypothetical protein [Vibrio taketomensis]|uniref:hypothetical protein n=1 Tax=Vibrio taketomensis TaxID=2572923 RepID=UPI001389FCE4|nr:hypothetical protein [Vibrio taketomensis]
MKFTTLSLLAASLLCSTYTVANTGNCSGHYVSPNVVDAMRSHHGVIEVPLNINGSVAIVLTSDAIIDEHSSGVRLTSDVAENKQSVVVHAYGTDVEGTAEFNIETARGRMHTIRLVFGNHPATTHKVVIEG